MPQPIEEMAQDVKANPIKSELVLLDTRLTYGGFPSRPFFYFMNGDQPDKTYKNEQVKAMVHSHLEDKLKILNDAHFVIDIAQNRVPKYRMTDEFKKLLGSQPVAGR